MPLPIEPDATSPSSEPPAESPSAPPSEPSSDRAPPAACQPMPQETRMDEPPVPPPAEGCGLGHPTALRPHHRRDPQNLRRPGRVGAGDAGGPVLRRARAHRERARPGQDALRADAGPRAGLPVRPHPVHRRPDALGHHRLADLRPEDAGVPFPPRAGLHPAPAGRRDQPLAGQDPRRAAGNHAGVPGDGRTARATSSSGRSWCMATQNPIESEGTYNLPEAQLDRFMFKLLVHYPSAEEEARVLAHAQRAGGPRPAGWRSCRP